MNKGVATRALSAFLDDLQVRPLYARAAKDNIGSLRVLEKCGFARIGEDKGFSKPRGVEVEEVNGLIGGDANQDLGRRAGIGGKERHVRDPLPHLEGTHLLAGGGIENWFAYMLALVFLLFRPQGLFGERIIERI